MIMLSSHSQYLDIILKFVNFRIVGTIYESQLLYIKQILDECKYTKMWSYKRIFK